MNRRMMTMVLAALILSSLGRARAQDAKKELAKFEGEWKVTAVESKGQKAEADAYKDFKLVVKGDKFTFHTGGDKIEGTIKPDASKSPKTLDVEGKDGAGNPITSAGIYEIDKDTIKICYVVNSQDRPKEFKTSADSEAFLVVYQREKK